MGKMKYGQKAKHPKKAMLRLFKMIFGKNPLLIIFILACVLVSSFAAVYSASFIGTFIDSIVAPLIGVADPDFTPAINALMKYGIVVIVSTVTSFVLSYSMVGVAQRAIYKIRIEMFDKLESLPLSYFDQNPHGAIMSRFSNDTDTLNQMISNGLVQLLTAGVTLVMIVISMIMKSWILSIIVLVFVFLLIKVTGSVGKKSSKEYHNQQKNLGEVNGFIEEMISGQRVIKVFTHEEKSKEQFAELNENLRVSMTKANGLANMMGPISNNLGNIQYVVLVIVGALIAINTKGIFTVGALAAFLQLSRSFSNNIGQITQQSNNVLLALAGAERIFELLDQEGEKDDGAVTLVNAKEENGEIRECEEKSHLWAWKRTDGSLVPLKGSIVMDHVDFSYVPGHPILKDISLYAKPGQKIAFVGATGAGKTTITNLLNRFYSIEKGSITFDGVDIKDIKLSDLRHSLGMILQDTNLFTGTIRDNIRYGRLDATDEEIVAAAKLANAHDFIMMMKDGYDTMITNNGEGLSQGQRQLLSIARAAVADPPVLVMDEATSSIDTHTEQLVQKGMDRLMENRTVFVIAHRLSTVRNSNAIMVLDHGKIIERGNHDDLLKEKGLYYKLYTGSVELQ